MGSLPAERTILKHIKGKTEWRLSGARSTASTNELTCVLVCFNMVINKFLTQSGLEVVPAWSHKPNDGGSSPSSATNFIGV